MPKLKACLFYAMNTLDYTKIKLGLLKTTTVNFPGHLAVAVFLPGCNLRCGYCYNGELAKSDPAGKALTHTQNEYATLADVFEHIEKRKNVINALAISGGEPLISPYLEPLIEKAKSANYIVKLDTNGLFPEKLENLLHYYSPPISMVAVDIKTSFERYNELLCGQSKTAGNDIKTKLLKTIETLKEAQASKNIAVEFRTVLVPHLVGRAEIETIACHLPHDASWEFAQFSPENCLDAAYNKINPYTEAEIAELVNLAKTFVPKAKLR